jgi:hypothetical protein
MHLLLPVSIFLVVVAVVKFLFLGLLVFAFILTFRLIRGTLGFLGGMMFGFHSHRHGCCAAHRHVQARAVPPRPVVPPRPEVRRAVVQPVQVPRAYQEVPRRPYRSGAPTWSLMVLGILFFCLVAFGFRLREVMAFEGPTTPGANPAVKPYSSTHEVWHVVKDGWGKTGEDARRDALTKAYDQFLNEVRGMSPPVEWRPTADYLETRLGNRLRWTDEPADTFPDPVGRMEHVKLTVDITDQDRQEIRRLDQEVRREGRLLFLAKILAGVLVFLAAVAGYIRLDEWSKGYYTAWLRLGAASLVGAAGAAVWLFLQHR